MSSLERIIRLAHSISETVLKGGKIDGTALDRIFSIEDEHYILEKINDKDAFEQYQKNRGDLNDKRDEQWKKLEMQSVKRPRTFTLRNMSRIAIVLIGMALVVGYLYRQKVGISHSDNIYNDNAVTLQLEDGTIKIIDTEKQEDIVNSKGEIVGVQNKDSISYRTTFAEEKLAFNELKVPYGKKFLLSLSDGTLVHLNAGTSIKYPVKFLNGNKREVFLDGEAYFNVAEDKLHPFLVNTGNFHVEVLGTKFNILSYEEDEQINTAVVSGLVRVYGSGPEDQAYVTAGSMASLHKLTGSTLIREVDLDLHVGWTEGKLIFRRTVFSAMIKKLERIYDVQITSSNNKLNCMVFSATFDINLESVDQILNYMSKNYHFTYSRNQKNITIN